MVLKLAGGVTIAIWLHILLLRRADWRGSVSNIPKSWPRVAAVIPARNEENTIAVAVKSLDKQNYRGPFHIVVVDDASEDDTSARALAAAPPSRLSVVRAASLPPGWTGKLWAMAEGVRRAERFEPEYLLFTDADLVHPPGNLAALVACALEGDCALVSYMATLRCRTFAERALVPAFVFFFFLLYPPPRIRDPRCSTAGAAGGCILLRRDALEKMGGLEAIRGALIDDCALAAAVKRSGGRLWLGLGKETQSLRDYRTFGDVGQMISRTAFTQLRYSTLLLLGTLAAMAITFVAPPVLALAAPQPARGMGALGWLLMSVAYLPALRYYGRSPLWAPFLPLVAIFYGAATVHSATAHWRGAGGLWKGRYEKRV